MSVYTVQAPLDSLGETELEKAVFLREGFSWPAFFCAFLWLLWHRFWVIAAFWLAISAGLAWLLLTRLSFGSFLLIALALRIWLGLEARALLRRKLARQNYRLVDVVTAESLEVAERTFFSRVAQDQGGSTPKSPPPAPPPLPGHHGEVLGLFPEPETGR